MKRTATTVTIATLALTGMSACGPNSAKPPRGSKSPRRWKEIVEPARVAELRDLADNEAARFARALYAEAWNVASPPGFAEPTMFIALENGGNFARIGFELEQTSGAVRSFPAMPYLILEADAEGFVASVFFHVMASDCAGLDALTPRYRALFVALRAAERGTGEFDHVPLIDIIAALASADPASGQRAVRAFLDLSRGVTVDAGAQALWSRFFDSVLHVELAERKAVSHMIERRRRAWETRATANPAFLASRVGPAIVVQSPGVLVGIALFGPRNPLTFDINAAGAAMLRLVPGLTADHITAMLTMRAEQPFRDAADFADRTSSLGLPKNALVSPTKR